jgi:hypothetical protein
MATQNLVSAVLTPELKNSIITKLTEVKTDLNFSVSFEPGEKKEYLSVGNVMLPFLDKAHGVITSHPEIMPAVFEKEEFLKDYQLSKDLVPILNQLTELASAVQNTLHAANSDAMVESLEIYTAAMQNVGKIPGMDVSVAEMKDFFKKGKKITNKAQQQQ